MLPNFLIIGAQKAGSTFIHKCVREHPDVYMPRHETSFLEDPEYLHTDFSQFEALFDAVKHEKAVGIKRPDYLARPECPERIHKHLPNAKLIIVLRDPVARAASAYYWFMQVGIIPIRPLEEGLYDIVHGRYIERYAKSQEVIDYGFYHQHLIRYLRYFDRNQLLIMLYSDLKANPQQSIAQVYRFLEIDESYVPKTLTRRPKQSVYSLARLKWLSVANRSFFYTYRSYDDNMVALHPTNSRPFKLVYYMFVAIDRYLLAFIFDNTKPKLSKCLKNILLEIYRKDICELEKLLGWELTAWKCKA